MTPLSFFYTIRTTLSCLLKKVVTQICPQPFKGSFSFLPEGELNLEICFWMQWGHHWLKMTWIKSLNGWVGGVKRKVKVTVRTFSRTIECFFVFSEWQQTPLKCNLVVSPPPITVNISSHPRPFERKARERHSISSQTTRAGAKKKWSTRWMLRIQVGRLSRCTKLFLPLASHIKLSYWPFFLSKNQIIYISLNKLLSSFFFKPIKKWSSLFRNRIKFEQWNFL